MSGCPHGDSTCPCQDGDSCHYEGVDAMACPNPPPGARSGHAHCHLEGCRYEVTDQDGCGLAGMYGGSIPPRFDRICGAVRAADAIMADL